MNIFVHGNGHAGMSENLRQTINIETKLHTTGGKGMTGGMEIGILNAAFLQYSFETVLHYPRFNKTILITRKKEPFRFDIWLQILYKHIR